MVLTNIYHPRDEWGYGDNTRDSEQQNRPSI